MMFVHGFVHIDCHGGVCACGVGGGHRWSRMTPARTGNVLARMVIDARGRKQPQLVLIDWGMMRRLTPEFRCARGHVM